MATTPPDAGVLRQRALRTCEICGEEFLAYPTQKYCSLPKDCAAIAAKRRAIAINQRKKDEKDRKNGVCPTCGQRLPKTSGS